MSRLETEPETLEQTGTRGRGVGVAATVLLLALGLSQAVGALEGDDPAAPHPPSAQAERRVALGADAGIQAGTEAGVQARDGDGLRGWCPCQWRRSTRQQRRFERARRIAVLEEGFIAFARLIDAAAADPESARFLTPAERPPRQVVRAWVRALRSGDVRAVRRLYARDYSVFFLRGGLARHWVESSSQAVATVGDLMTRRLSITTRIVGRGRFAEARYADGRSHGIVLVRAAGGRITEQWVVVDE